MTLPLKWITARALRLEERLCDPGDLAAVALSGKTAQLEASLHEIGHIVALRGSLLNALHSVPVCHINRLMTDMGMHGIVRDENEVSAIAVELLTAEMLGHPINAHEVTWFAWTNNNVRHFSDIALFEARVARRMKNPRCRNLAAEVAHYLSRSIRKIKRSA